MQLGGAEVGSKLLRREPAGKLGRTAAAELGPGPPAGQHPVEEHRQGELVGEAIGERQRLGARGPAPGLVEVDDRRDVEDADPGVDTVVAGEGEALHRFARAREDPSSQFPLAVRPA